MSQLNGKWLLTNDRKLYNTDDLTGYRVERETYNPVICASNKFTGERVFIDWLPEEYSFCQQQLSVQKLYPINEIVSTKTQSVGLLRQ